MIARGMKKNLNRSREMKRSTKIQRGNAFTKIFKICEERKCRSDSLILFGI